MKFKLKKKQLFHSGASLPAELLCPIRRDTTHVTITLNSGHSYGSSVLLFSVLHSLNSSWKQRSILEVLRIAQKWFQAHFVHGRKGLSW